MPPVDPIAFRIGPIAVHWYGILAVTGVLLGSYYAALEARRKGQNPDHVWNGLTLCVILAIIGARLYHVFSSPRGGGVGWEYYRQNLVAIFEIWRGGLGIFGAIVGGVLGALIYTWWAKLKPLCWLDFGAPGLVLGQAIGRWGNWINQELYGQPTDLPWGIPIDLVHRIEPYNDLSLYPLETRFHPTFLYESLWCLLVFVALAVIARRLGDRLLEGDIFLGYLIGYPLGRFFVEFFRPDAWMIGSIAAAQLFSVLLVVGATAALVVRHVRAPVPAAPEPIPETPAEEQELIETESAD